MRILIMGSGAVGSVITGYLSRGGRDVITIDPWYQHVSAIRERGLTVQSLEETFTTEPDVRHLSDLDEVGEADLIIIATKSYDTRWMARLARDHMAAGAVALSAQNGMNDDALAEIFGREHVLGCVVAMAVELFTPAEARRTSGSEWGSLIIGDLGYGADAGRIPEIANGLSALDGVSTAGNLWPDRWGKLTLNVMSNALGGLTGMTTKGLWSDDRVLDVLIALGHETAKVAKANGITLAPVLKVISHDQWLAATDTSSAAWEDIRQAMYKVAESRSGDKENLPSLLQDIKKGRRTEIDYLNGWVVGAGAKAGIPTPANAAIVEAVRPLELAKIPCAPENVLPLAQYVREQYAPARG